MKYKTPKMLIGLLAVSVLLCGAFFQTGCSTTGNAPSITKQDVITGAEIAAGLIINDRSKVEEALKIIRDARKLVSEGGEITVAGLGDYVVTRALQSRNLSPGEVAALKSFLRRFTDKMTLELDSIGIDPQVVVTVSEVLDAVERVALEIDRFGAPLQRSYSVSQKLDPRWHDGVRWMLVNPQPLPPEVEAHLNSK